MAAQSTAIPVTATGAVVGNPCTLRGFHIASTAGATVVLYDNAAAASGTILGQFVLAAGADRQVDISDGVRCANGIFISTTAAVQGHVRIG
jgi:hypothetical protein